RGEAAALADGDLDRTGPGAAVVGGAEEHDPPLHDQVLDLLGALLVGFLSDVDAAGVRAHRVVDGEHLVVAAADRKRLAPRLPAVLRARRVDPVLHADAGEDRRAGRAERDLRVAAALAALVESGVGPRGAAVGGRIDLVRRAAIGARQRDRRADEV